MYLRQNAAREFIGDMRDTSQSTISRYVAVLVPIVKAVLEEFVPSAEEVIEIVRDRVILADGKLAPCWSYEEHYMTLGQPGWLLYKWCFYELRPPALTINSLQPIGT